MKSDSESSTKKHERRRLGSASNC